MKRDNQQEENKLSNVMVVVGGQYGSEAKGHATAQLVKIATRQGRQVVNVRVAGPNAGHTVYDDEGVKFAFRQVPVGAVVEPIVSVIAAGSEIDFPVLLEEIHAALDEGHILDLKVDQNATLIEYHHKMQEQEGKMVENIGSTAKGIGAARAERVWRKARRLQDVPEAVALLRQLPGVSVVDTVDYLHRVASERNVNIVVEGTQGYGLGVHTAAYPQTTSSDCRAIDFLAMAGISPWHAGIDKVQVLIACRVYPIRVAGNSGPMKNETTWEALGLPEERTTVTQKVRRVGDWDGELVAEAFRANGGVVIPEDDVEALLWQGVTGGPRVAVALTMLDQVIPEIAGLESFDDCDEVVLQKVEEWINKVYAETGAIVTMVTTSPKTAVLLGV
ncbi:2-aminooxy adenylosuccinate synthetase [Arthrobacter phage HunterDalle]|uniref:N6-succino-2-amino-2'-deoxyadenylate synthase n=2 Tax=Korravirus hunterdalle TaxID=1982080 RepID=A0A0U4IYU5_9CAUD|nr:2-aminooxy adenylosuccinate synthetase [Arthrobacter phage HunterDalle]ALY09196.1 PurA-like adenylosuccinate synthetase [Arthrobacter phage HunterDalle]ALY10711.1 PurA-like adenylosuccinate synthetase [Arthrobacter phage Vulture]